MTTIETAPAEDAPTVNVDLLRTELQYVTDHRDEWKQSHWLHPTTKSACGTTGCLFGNAALHAGRVIPLKGADGDIWAYKPDHPSGDWIELGAELFGLDFTDAADLAWGQNSLFDLWAIANEITNGAIEIPQSVRDEGTRVTASVDD